MKEAVVTPPRLDETSMTELAAEQVARNYVSEIIFEAEKTKGCCHHHFVEAKELKEAWRGKTN
jgi:hypothetical protein